MFDVADTADIAFGDFLIDHRRRALLAGGKPVPLQQRTFDLLAFLAAHRDRVVSRDEILAHVFGGQLRAAGNVPVQVHNLRRALAQAGSETGVIQTQGQGYRFVAEAKLIGRAPAAAPIPVPVPEDDISATGRARWWRRRIVWAPLLALCLAACMLYGSRVLGISLPGPVAPGFAPPPHSMAVLAFTNMSGDPGQDIFADGLSEELIDALSRVRQLKVAARTSSFYFKGKQTTIAEIAHALNVGAVLQGSVRRQNHHVRIGWVLTDALTGYQLGTDMYDRDEGDLLGLEQETAVAVAKALQTTLLGEAPTDLTLGGTANPAAFDHYLQAVQLRRKNALRDSVAAFQAAIALDPNYALAYSGLAEAAMRRVWVGYDLNGDDADKLVGLALASAERGVALAPTVGLTHAVRAQMLREAKYDLPAAMKEAERARSLTPGDAAVELIYGQVAGSRGDVEGALAAYRHAVALDPMREETWAFYGFGLMAARHYEASIEALRHAISVATGFVPEVVAAIGLDDILLGRPKEALKTCADDSGQAHFCLALADIADGRKADADREIVLLKKLSGRDDDDCNFAMIYAAAGRIADAMRVFQQMAHTRDSCLNVLGGVRNNPFWDPLRGLPAFEASIKESEQPP